RGRPAAPRPAVRQAGRSLGSERPGPALSGGGGAAGKGPARLRRGGAPARAADVSAAARRDPRCRRGEPMSILVLNAGSSTLKFVLFAEDPLDELGAGMVDWKSNASKASISFRAAGAAAQQEPTTIN